MRNFILSFALLFSTIFGVEAQHLEVIGDGASTTSPRIPVYGLWFDYQQKSQIIYPQEKLTELVGNKITKITFFSDVVDIDPVNTAWQNDIHIRMANTEQNDLSAGWFTGSTTEVFVGKLNISSDSKMVIELDTPFEYTGNNLFIEFDLPTVTSTTSKAARFHGTTETYIVSRQAQSTGYTEEGMPFDFLPKMIIDFIYGDTGYTAATNVQATANGSNVIVTWDAPAVTEDYTYTITRDGAEIATEVTEATYTDSNVANGTYTYCVKVVYEDGVSAPVCDDVTVNASDCAPATNVSAVSNGSSVNLTWMAPTKGREVILSEGFEDGLPNEWTQIDADGDGYMWGILGALGHDGSDNSISSASYWAAAGELTPDNYLITPLVEGATSINYWVCAQHNSWSAEHYAVMASTTGTNAADFTIVFQETMTGKGAIPQGEKSKDSPKASTWYERTIQLPAGTKYIAFRHYNCTDQWWLNIDDVTVYAGNPIVVNDYTYTLTRNGVEIATGLTTTNYTDSNIEIGNTYEYCIEVVYPECTSEPACDILPYIGPGECNPATNVQAVADGYTVKLSWESPVEKNRDVLLNEKFDSPNVPEGWTQIDADGDGHIWGIMQGVDGFGSLGTCISSESWAPNGVGALTPDNYLITPLVDGATSVIYWVSVQTEVYPAEHYALMASTTGTNLADFTMVFEETMTAKGDVSVEGTRDNSKQGAWYQREIELPEGTKYIAWRHYNCTYQLYLNLDNVTVFSNIAPAYTYTITRDDVEIASGLTTTNYADQHVPAGDHTYCVKVVYPDCVSESACDDVTITDSCNPVTNVTANHSIEQGQNNVTVAWNAPERKSREIILAEQFEDGIPSDWTLIDADQDGLNWEQMSVFEGHNGGLCVSSASYLNGVGPQFPDNYLITPLVAGATSVNYWVSAQDAEYAEEHYAVMASSTGTNASNFTILFEETMTAKGNRYEGERGKAETGTWYERTVELPEGTKYVAFRHYDSSDHFWLNVDNVTVHGTPVTDYTYTITRNGTEIANELTRTTYKDNNVAEGTYDYCVKVVYATCTSEPACASQLTVGIDNEVANAIKVYPNPAKDIINVDGNITNITMHNSLGQAVRTDIYNGKIDVTSLQNGIYYLEITGSNSIRKVEKVIITK